VFNDVCGEFGNVCEETLADWFLVNGQLDAQFFSMCLFQFSTCFKQPRAHHQQNQLYQYNLWYMSLCVGDRTKQSPTQSDMYQRLY
jgi:hypothetical protein